MRVLEKPYAIAQNNIDSLLALVSSKDKELKKTNGGALQKTTLQQRERIRKLHNKLCEDSIRYAEAILRSNSDRETTESDLMKNIMETHKFLEEIERLSSLKFKAALIELTNKKKRLTTKAAKTKQLKVTLQISDQVEDFNVKILDPQGKEIQLNTSNFAIDIKDPDPTGHSESFFVSPDVHIDALKKVRQVELTYTCSAKLAPGLYSINAFNGNDLIGNLKARLE